MNHGLCQQRSRSRTVTSDIVGLGRNFFNELCAHVFERIFEFNVAGNRYTIVGDGRCAEFLFEHYVTAFRAKGYFYGVSQCIHTAAQSAASFFVKQNLFSHLYYLQKIL